MQNKFEKQLKSKAYKHNDVLEVREYVINWNRVLVCFQKIVLTDKLASLGISHIVLTEEVERLAMFGHEVADFLEQLFQGVGIGR